MYNPTVIDNDGRQERHFDIFSRLLRDRIIFLGTEVNDQVAASLVAQLLYLEAEDPTKDITLLKVEEYKLIFFSLILLLL